VSAHPSQAGFPWPYARQNPGENHRLPLVSSPWKKRKTPKIEEKDVEKVLLHLRRQKATFSELNRGAKKGDRVELSYEGSIKGVKKDAMSAKNHPLILGDNTLIPGFEEEIVGMKKGEMKKDLMEHTQHIYLKKE